MHAERGRAQGGRGRGRAKWLELLLGRLPAMPLAQLREVWGSALCCEAPALPEGLLRRLLAHRLQEHRHGGLPPLVARELRKLASGARAGPAPAPAARPAPTLGPGTRLIREWNGKTIAVQVREDGYLWEGRHYTSLSRIACEVTGARWSGPRFFGLRRPQANGNSNA